MCHVIFALPVASLLLFSFLPFGDALPSFLLINAVSFFLFYKIYRVMRMRPEIGMVSMIGKHGTVVEENNSEGRVLIENELWFAASDERLRPGQRCVVVGFRGLTAVVKPAV